MRRFATLVLLALGLSVMAASPASADEAAFFFTDLTGAEEAPGPGDPNGTGFAQVVTVPRLGLVCYAIFVQNIALPATGAHIHAAPAGEPGPIVVPLKEPGANGFSGGCTNADPALVQAIQDNPENYYVNVHSTEFRPGAVRGQLGD